MKDKDWLDFSLKVRERDNNCCVQCGRSKYTIRLYVYPKIAFEECSRKEFDLNDYHSLCSGCIAINKSDKIDLSMLSTNNILATL